MHTLNSVLIIIEISISRMSLYWGYLPLSLITLGLYLSLAYLSHYLHGRYRTRHSVRLSCSTLLTISDSVPLP